MDDRAPMALTSTPTTVLLGGGYTLQRVAGLLPSHSFVITSRNEEQCEKWRALGWNALRVDSEAPETLSQLFTRYPTLSIVVDSIPPLSGARPSAGVANIVAAIEGTQVSKVIYLSTTGVFGLRDGSEVTEDTPPQPWNEQGRARLVCEDAYRAWASARAGRACTALRLPAIYGEDRGLLFALRRGSYRLIGDGSWWTNRIHVADLATIIAKAVDTELPGVLCVSDDCPARARDVVAFVCDRENLGFPRSISEQDALAAKSFTMLSNQRICNARMKALLGITLQYPSYREGMSLSAQ